MISILNKLNQTLSSTVQFNAYNTTSAKAKHNSSVAASESSMSISLGLPDLSCSSPLPKQESEEVIFMPPPSSLPYKQEPSYSVYLSSCSQPQQSSVNQHPSHRPPLTTTSLLQQHQQHQQINNGQPCFQITSHHRQHQLLMCQIGTLAYQLRQT